MFGMKSMMGNEQSTAIFLGEKNYSISTLVANKELVLNHSRAFVDSLPELVGQGLNEDVEQLGLLGKPIHVILNPKSYQIITMDALDVSEEEMAIMPLHFKTIKFSI
jgi:hypothetical protein